MKRIISILASVAILMTPVLGKAAGNTYTLNIQQAMDMAVENDKQKLVDDLNIKMKEAAQQEAKVTLLYGISAPSDEIDYKNNVEPLQYETDVEMAKRTKENNLSNLKLSVYKACLNVLLAENELAKEQQKLEIAEEKYKIMAVQMSQGEVTDSELLDMEYKVESKKLDIAKTKQKLEAARLELKKKLNCSLDKDDIVINDVIVFKDIKDLKLGNLITSTQSTDATIYEKTQTVKIKEKSLDQISHYFVQGEYNYQQAEYALEAAKYEKDDAYRKTETDISNKYNDLLSQKENAELAMRYADLVEKRFEATQVKYDNGLASKQDLLNALERKLDAEYQKLSAISTYSYTKADFENLVKHDISK